MPGCPIRRSETAPDLFLWRCRSSSRALHGELVQHSIHCFDERIIPMCAPFSHVDTHPHVWHRTTLFRIARRLVLRTQDKATCPP